jgi:hypothetical protein
LTDCLAQQDFFVPTCKTGVVVGRLNPFNIFYVNEEIGGAILCFRTSPSYGWSYSSGVHCEAASMYADMCEKMWPARQRWQLVSSREFGSDAGACFGRMVAYSSLTPKSGYVRVAGENEAAGAAVAAVVVSE